MPSVLLVDDDAQLCTALAASLTAQRFTVDWRCTGQEAIALAQHQDFDVVVCDLNMPAMSGIALCTQLRELRPDLPVVVLTAFGNYETAVEAIRAGAYDFLAKPVKVDVLAIAVNRAIAHHQLTTEVKRLRSEANRHSLTKEFTGASLAMRRVQDTIARVAPTDALVLITGESGTGKEVAARAVHTASPRSNKPFVAINCAALPENLLESELFGHQRGAFTDAKDARLGILREAAGGTVFLDEIGDMPLGLQPKLLRVIQERRVRPVGASQEIPIDVRFIAATNADLEAAIESKRFREDLYFRLAVVSLDLPPLRARGDADILALAQRFIGRVAETLGKQVRGLAPATAKRLLEYPWPGNVRELQNAMEHAVTLTAFDEILPQDLPDRVSRHRATTATTAPEMPDELLSLDEIERRYILHVLRAVGGNKSAAARILRIERKTLYRKFAEWDASGTADPSSEP